MPIPDFFFGKELTIEQKHYYEMANKKKVLIVNAPSGTGKTWLAVGFAKKQNKKCHYIFSPVQQDSLGHLPGDPEEKVKPYLLPLEDALEGIGEIPEKAIFSKKEFRESAWVFPSPHTFWRGGNIQNSVVIIDEAQNFTKHELKKILTRIHESNTVFVIGHDKQCDLKNPAKSGFIPYIEHAKTVGFTEIITLSTDFRGMICRWADEIA